MSRNELLRRSAGLTTAVLLAGGAVLGLHASNLHNGLIAASFTAVGLFVVRRRPEHREGWLFVATGCAHAVMYVGRQYGLHEAVLPGAAWVGWIGVWPLPLVLVLVAVTLMCFPTGRMPSPRWHPLLVVLAVLGGVLSLVSALWPVEYPRTGLVAEHPLDIPGAEAATAAFSVLRPACYLLFQLAAAAVVGWRVAHADADEARQLRWFGFAVALCALVMVSGLLLWGSPLPGVLSVPLIAVAAGAAILKYRLYDIDPVINRSVVLAGLGVAVGLGYTGLVAGTGRLVHGHDTALSLGATAVVAVLFEPLRSRLQRLADRLVYGRRATPYEALARLSGGLTHSTGGLLDGMCQTLADGLGARRVVLWTGPEDELRVASRWPADVPGPESPSHLDELDAVPIVHDGRFLGAVTVSKPLGATFTAAERRLLVDLAAQAGLILELRARAGRLVAAGDAVRRHFERDLHDGVQQRMVTLGLELGGLVRAAEGAGLAEVTDRARAAHAQLLTANAELRELARGLHPAVLTQDGLEAAMGFLADRAPLPVRLEVKADRRLAEEVEATVYFVVAEALTNVAKHSGAAQAEVRVEVRDTSVLLEVGDDGRGGARLTAGGGLEGIADRLATLGAGLGLDSGPAGTRLSTVISCG